MFFDFGQAPSPRPPMRANPFWSRRNQQTCKHFTAPATGMRLPTGLVYLLLSILLRRLEFLQIQPNMEAWIHSEGTRSEIYIFLQLYHSCLFLEVI